MNAPSASSPPFPDQVRIGTPPRFNVQGVGVHALTLEDACSLIVQGAKQRERRYVCCCDAHSISWARRSPAHRRTLNSAYLATPDGMPIVWLGKRSGLGPVNRVYGPDLLQAVCRATVGRDCSHFFYGAGPGTAALLAETLPARFPGLRIAGTFTPPFGPLPEASRQVLAARLREVKPDIFWVGLSTPKQEAFMSEYSGQLDAGIMIGVGAAFDFLSGRVRQAPRWIRGSGIEWLWRLSQEPRRLAPRYLRSAPLFALRAAAQLTGVKRYPLGDR